MASKDSSGVVPGLSNLAANPRQQTETRYSEIGRIWSVPARTREAQASSGCGPFSSLHFSCPQILTCIH